MVGEPATIWRWLADVPDPEIPAVSVVDLGIVRGVRWDDGAARWVVTVTPTYSGCPATEVIADSIREALQQRGVDRPLVEMQLSPAWTTEWMTPIAREKLRGYGIAPPAEQPIDASRILRRAASAPTVACPRCGSTHTERLSEFGSTPCKALYRCRDCREPFDYFKAH
ncbi:MAG TPA: 1,2-phenylacetyl-CoA epoxidase subunit PaaD [Nevskiaceae bacterium]|nr:1,2-phenylacetyl-CoA epoxidase subunit PaaD [Nevskiaceae bacterium]